MKKYLVILLTVLCVLSLFGCGKKEDVNEVNQNQETQTGGDGDVMVGGFTICDDIPSLCTPKQKEIFDEATSGLTGVGYTPICELGTQVVAGKNHMFLCKGTSVTANPETNLYALVIYEDLNGNKELMKINKLDISEFAQDNSAETEQLAGGWYTDDLVPNIAIDADAAEAISEAKEGLLGVTYNNFALLGKQVVAGTNYLVLTKAFVAVPDSKPYYAVLNVYKPLEGKATINSIYALDLAKINGLEGK